MTPQCAESILRANFILSRVAVLMNDEIGAFCGGTILTKNKVLTGTLYIILIIQLVDSI